MIRAPFLALTLLTALAFTAPSQAGSLKVAGQNMRLAVEICLRNYLDATGLPQAFGAAGYAVTQVDGDFWEFQAPGVSGGFVRRAVNAQCHVQSQDVPLALAEEIGLKLARQLFGDKVERGGPEQPVGAPVPPCGGLSIYAPRLLIVVTYSAAGNSGDCLNDGTSAIALKL